jgi:diketogulonate reductase-like aldo/keto reductase
MTPANTRRSVLASLAGLGAAASLGLRIAEPRAAAPGPKLMRAIPSTGEQIPAVGLGTWITFNVGEDKTLRDARAKVMAEFFERGGTMIDSSPMYGSSEAVIGHGLARLPGKRFLFAATKVWTLWQGTGQRQIRDSHRLWGLPRFDLIQVHNLLRWESHLETLRGEKAAGRLRYIGVTTSHGRRHDELEAIMKTEKIEFVQFTYNIVEREAEQRLLPLAAERKLAVIINRPFEQGDLMERFGKKKLPEWAGEIDCANWAQFLLKFIVSHPAVTCVIPATSRVDHLQENMGALHGRLPDAKMRARMVQYVERL